MMTSSRPRDIGGSFASRRGHANQLSISDPSHHITETIGTLYGDEDDYSDESRPMSFVASPYGGEQIMKHRGDENHASNDYPLRRMRSNSDHRNGQNPPSPTTNGNGSSAQKSQGPLRRMPSNRSSSYEGNSPKSPMSPTLRDMREEESSSFPLGNIDNPNDIAQELSNLQALRRMSMDVSNTHDPDMLPFSGISLMAMPSIAPQGDDDEADPSRLLWVPAGVHPELAPTEFKNFLEKRVQSMKRRSAESTLSADSLDNGISGAGGGLRRKKSMLSRQIDSRGADGYVDGAERLERKRSINQSGHAPLELSLDELVKDPAKAVQKLTLESASGDSPTGDMPILPVLPGTGLRRSTRTTYRKGGSLRNRHGAGSLKSGEKKYSPFSERMATQKSKTDEEYQSDASPVTELSPIDAPKGHGLTRVQSEPVTENYSRPTRSVRRQQTFTREQSGSFENSQSEAQESGSGRPELRRNQSSDALRTSSTVPPLIETLAVEEPQQAQAPEQQQRPFPVRSSSQKSPTQVVPPQNSIPEEPPARSSKRPNYSQPSPPLSQPPSQPQGMAKPQQSTRTQGNSSQTLDDMAHHPAPLPGGGATRTDTLTFIPTFASDDKKADKKSKRDKSDSETTSSKSTSWKWFKSDDKEKKKKDEENKKSKSKALAEKTQDNVRLDVLQTSIDNVKQKGRESILLDRDSIDNKLEEERKKENNRKTSDSKKEKDGLFANFFGGGKKKGDRDSGGKKHHHHRPLSPEPAPYKPLVPDVDYHWTRFPILEERAIYRMAHIKLANPRRALYSQVLLSNFMYAYLAKVQAMHPQIQVPQSPQQKRLQEEERKRREQEQQYLEQQQAQDNIDRYNFEYHRSGNQYGDSAMQEGGDYPEEAEMYGYDPKEQNGDINMAYRDDRRQDDDDDMW